MSNPSPSTPDQITPQLITAVADRIRENGRLRRNLPRGGRIHVDRQVPYVVVFRERSAERDGDARRFVVGEPAYIIAPASRTFAAGVRSLTGTVVKELSAQFGAVLLIEVWEEPEGWEEDKSGMAPGFQVLARQSDAPETTASALAVALGEITVLKRRASAGVSYGRRASPRGLGPLLSATEAAEARCSQLGVAVRPIYRHSSNGQSYPVVTRVLRRGIGRALKQAAFVFAHDHTTQRPADYRALGRQAVVRAVWEVDRQLAAVSDSFDFLLSITPVNVEQSWRRFQGRKYRGNPVFHYRPLPIDPDLLKRDLYAIRMERIEDPVLARLFRQKRDELDRRLTMLLDRDTDRFVLGSLQVYGSVGAPLMEAAEDILRRVAPSSDRRAGEKRLTAKQFAEMARQEIAHYQELLPKFSAEVDIRSDVVAGLMVSRGKLLIGDRTSIPTARADALLQHEIGTHMLTYYNGRSQRLRQLYVGLPGYSALQEGLAVLAEYLVGGLSPDRLRTLAARVVGIDCLLQKATFVDTCEKLHRDYGIPRRTAFTITARIYRSGGLTKDAVYLRGLMDLMVYLRAGHELEPLFVGKISEEHVPIIRELQLRGVLGTVPAYPRYLNRPDTQRRLERVRAGMTVTDLVRKERR